MSTLIRGQIVRANIGLDEPKLLLVVSNNRRNNALGTALTARLTTTSKHARLSSVVEIPDTEQVTGYVMCDDLMELWADEVLGHISALSPAAMGQVDEGLRAALDL